jgi:hypothetical protein
MADPQRVSLDEVIVHFQELEDPRSTINRRFPRPEKQSILGRMS